MKQNCVYFFLWQQSLGESLFCSWFLFHFFYNFQSPCVHWETETITYSRHWGVTEKHDNISMHRALLPGDYYVYKLSQLTANMNREMKKKKTIKQRWFNLCEPSFDSHRHRDYLRHYSERNKTNQNVSKGNIGRGLCIKVMCVRWKRKEGLQNDWIKNDKKRNINLATQKTLKTKVVVINLIRINGFCVASINKRIEGIGAQKIDETRRTMCVCLWSTKYFQV